MERAAVPGVHDHPGRPVPLPDGPVEHHERQALKASAAGFATGALATRNLRWAAAMIVTTPKAAVFGRDAFAAQLGRASFATDMRNAEAEVIAQHAAYDRPARPGTRRRLGTCHRCAKWSASAGAIASGATLCCWSGRV